MNERPTYEDLKQQVEALIKKNDALAESHRILEESERLHRLTLENISDTVLITDDEGKIIYACPNTSLYFRSFATRSIRFWEDT